MEASTSNGVDNQEKEENEISEEENTNSDNKTVDMIENTNSLKISTNLESADIDSDTQEKLKGDLIGDTMYSESFIVKTLLRFNNFEWSSDFEDDLCFLWDMTVEKDVCHYLFSLSFPSLVCDVILTENENRLIEILIGILGNICAPEDSPPLKPEEIDIVLQFLNSEDSLILIQVMRFIKTISHNSNVLSFITDGVMDKICYILTNSLNIPLLENSMDALSKITIDKKLSIDLISGEIVKASLEGYKVICDSESNTQFNIYRIEKIKNVTNHWIQILVNITSYTIESSNLDLVFQVDEQSEAFLSVINNILTCYQEDDEFELCTEDLGYIINALNYICPLLNVKHDALFFTLLNILTQLIDDLEFYKNICNAFVEILCFFISIYDLAEFKKNALPKHLGILEFIKSYNLECDHDFGDNLNSMIIFLNNG